MPLIHIETLIQAPPEVCFDLSRSVELHVASVPGTDERAIAGVTTGLMGPGDTVTWEAVHFGVRQCLTARITEYERPHRFVDEMVHGAFERFRHVHTFLPTEGGTRMVDDFDYTAPFGPLGLLANHLFLEAYMTRVLAGRCAHIKAAADGNA